MLVFIITHKAEVGWKVKKKNSKAVQNIERCRNDHLQ